MTQGSAAQSEGWAKFPLKDTMNWRLHSIQEWSLLRVQGKREGVGASPVSTGPLPVSGQGQGLQYFSTSRDAVLKQVNADLSASEKEIPV